MADTTFIDKQTQIVAAWLNDVNITLYRALGAGGVAPVTAANILTNLNLPQLAANNVWNGTNNFSAAAITVASILGNPVFAGNVTVQGTTTHSGAVTNSSTVQNTGAVTNASTVQNNSVVSNAAAVWINKGASVASAATTNIWTTDGNVLHVTGVITITSFGTAPQAGASKRVIFDGALTLTNGANLVLPGGGNLVTAAGDAIEVVADTTTLHRVVSYTPASGVSSAQPINVQPFATAGSFTWTKPSAPTGAMAMLQVWAGGGSGATSTNVGPTNSGGAGGAYCQIIIPLSSLGTTETVVVGVGGASVAGNNQNGNPGGDSYIRSLAFCGAKGGPGGNTNGNVLGGAIGGVYIGNAFWEGAGATSNAAGSNSIWGGASGGGGQTSAPGGTSLFGGNGGAAAPSTVGNGSPGVAPGGGGGGSNNGVSSGAGAVGKVVITVF